MKNDALLEMRRNIFMMAYTAGIGHIASAYSCLEILYTLYLEKIMNIDIMKLDSCTRDKFVMSKGHGSLALYVVLAEIGAFSKKELMTFSRPGSRLGGEPNKNELPGIEATTGSLGHGITYALGIALADKMAGRDCKTYCLIGDGESQEGSVWEVAMLASKYKLDNFVVILDHNRLQKMGAVTDVMGISSWDNKWTSFGWDLLNVDGHDIDKLNNCFSSIQANGKPHIVIADTVKGKGVSIMENDPGWHWRLPSKKELKVVLEELGISREELDIAKSIYK